MKPQTFICILLSCVSLQAQQEAEAGTNPFNAKLPDGFVIPELMPEQTAGTYTLLWPTVAGKLHQLQGSEALAPGTQVLLPRRHQRHRSGQ